MKIKTIVLPGYSEHNREWAEEVAKELRSNGITTTTHNWLHWKSTQEELNVKSGAMAKSGLSLKSEIERLLTEIGNDKVNIIAKSVGVYVALKIIPLLNGQLNKIILCGIASVASEDRSDLLRTLTSIVSFEKILCIQNENDKYVPYSEAEKFYHSVEPKLEVVSMPRADHDYPYTNEFIKFLKE